MLAKFTKSLYQPALAFLFVLFIFSCKKDIGNHNNSIIQVFDPETKISSTVSGFVTDENNAAVAGATVKAGNLQVSTDQYGYFEIKNADMVKSAAVVAVTKAGYFKSIKTYTATAGKAAFFRIKLIPKVSAGNINALAGGNVALLNGLIIALPENAVVDAVSGVAYSGNINVAASWIDPSSPELNKIMPGDLRGINDAGFLQKLTTYGMAAVELTGASGELLQIAPGKKATLTFPLHPSLLVTAPASIPLWYFDENNGLWKQEGNAVKTGNAYVGDVSHFSFWNCDVPSTYIQFDCTVTDAAGNPVPFAAVKISVVSDPSDNAWGYTDYSGYTSGAVPDNAQLLLEIFSDYGCTNAVFSQAFSTTNVNISLGNIVINAASTATVSGTATNCSSTPVTNGYVVMLNGTQYGRYPLTTGGTYNFSTLLCTPTAGVTFVAEDLTTFQQSTPLNYTLNPGNNIVGNLTACGISAAEFFNYTVNGSSYSFSSPVDTLYHSNYGGNNIASIGAINTTNHYTYISFDNTGVALNSTQNLITFYSTDTPDSAHVTTPVSVTITEYGNIGAFISGNFSGPFTGNPPANNVYNISGAFRVRRNF